MIKEIDYHLLIWAATYGGGIRGETGYRGATVLHKLMVENGIKLPSKKPCSGVMPDEEIAARVEKAVLSLPDILKICVLIRYLGNNTAEEGGQKMRMASQTFRRNISFSHYAIFGYINALRKATVSDLANTRGGF